MLIAIIVLSVIAYLAVGATLARFVFKPIWETKLHAYFDAETAAGTGLLWPLLLVAGFIICVFVGIGRLFGGDDP